MEHCHCDSTGSLACSHLSVPWAGDLEPVNCLTSSLYSRIEEIFHSHVIAAISL